MKALAGTELFAATLGRFVALGGYAAVMGLIPLRGWAALGEGFRVVGASKRLP
jgi:hypothetical protein